MPTLLQVDANGTAPCHEQLQTNPLQGNPPRPSVFARLSAASGTLAGPASSLSAYGVPIVTAGGAAQASQAPEPLATQPSAAPATGLQAPVQIGDFSFGVPTDVTAGCGVQPSAVCTTELLAPVQIGGFSFGLPISASSGSAAQPSPLPLEPPSPPSPITPPQAIQASWPVGFTPLSATFTAPVAPAQQQLEQQQHANMGSGSAVNRANKAERAKDYSLGRLMKMRTGVGIEALYAAGGILAELDKASDTPKETAAAASQSCQAAMPGSAQLDVVQSASTVVITVAREGHEPISTSGPRDTTFQCFLEEWSQWAGLSVDALCVSFQGSAVDRSLWGITFAQLGCSGEAAVEVKVITDLSMFGDVKQPSVADSQSTPMPAATSGSTSSSTVHVTVNREGHAAVSGDVLADAKLADLLRHWAQGQGLSPDALQVLNHGRVVDRAHWGISFAAATAESGEGPSFVFHVSVLGQEPSTSRASLQQSKKEPTPQPATTSEYSY